jgi:SAM-dependent methyltransferase
MTTSYDIVAYPNLCQPQTHPDRLAVAANMFGLDPAPPDACRVLEIGCGDGSNLLPLANAFPRSRFVGLDLAETRIQAGRAAIADLALTNLELAHCDLHDFPAQGDPFDYIIAHGVYSWVPAEARERMLALCRARLAPQGVAYVSYNCLPGCYLRRMAREIMRFHTREISDPSERVRQAIAVCQLIANSIEKPDTYRQLFKDQLEQIQRLRAGHLFHDDLAEINDPVYFHEFTAHAARHELQYLAEADFFEMQDDSFTPEAREIFARMEDSRLTREQYLDFVKCRRFRQTLLVHRTAPVQYPAIPTAIEQFQISSSVRGTPAENPTLASGLGATSYGQASQRFVHPRGGALEVGHPLGIHALHLLAERWPATLSFPELFESASIGANLGDRAAVARDGLLLILLEAYRAGVVDFRRTPIRCTRKPSTCPAVSRFARWQISRSPTVTTLRYENLRVEDAVGKRLLSLLDGTRTLDELEQCLLRDQAARTDSGAPVNGQLLPRLEELAQLALLES